MPLYPKPVICIALLLLIAGSLLALGETIYDIRVVGNQNIESSLVLSAITLRVGEPLDPEEAAKSIKNLNNLSIFSQVEIDTETYRNGVNLIITVSEYPIVSDVKFTGFKALNKDKLNELVTLKKGSYWSPQLKNQIIRKLEKEYLTKGVPLVGK